MLFYIEAIVRSPFHNLELHSQWKVFCHIVHGVSILGNVIPFSSGERLKAHCPPVVIHVKYCTEICETNTISMTNKCIH